MAAQACRQILTKLQTLSDQPASRPSTEGQLVHGSAPAGLRTRDRHALAVKSNRYADSSLPGRVSDQLNHAAELDRSLFHFYLPRMKQAIDDADLPQIYKLVQEAHEDYLEHVGQPSEAHFSSDHAAGDYLLGKCEGMSAERAAIKIHTRTQSLRSARRWVEEQRRRNGRHPETGAVVRVAERTRRIWELADEGVSQKEIAVRLEISQPTVSRALTGRVNNAVSPLTK